MNLLAFELSTEACSVAVLAGGEVRERHEVAPRKHAEYALPWAEALLAEAGIAKSQLDAVAVDADGMLDAILDGDEAVMPPDAVPAPDGDGPWHGVGTGFAALDGALRQRFADRLVAVDAEALPHAADVARLAAAALRRGEGIAPERLEPAYLRNDVALTLAQQQALRAARG